MSEADLGKRRYLTKSRYNLALDCPTKLFYSGKSKEYEDTSVADPFLMALARGGFQVGALAQSYYLGCRISGCGALPALPSFWYRLGPQLAPVKGSAPLPLSFGDVHLNPRLKVAMVHLIQGRADSTSRHLAA